VNDGRPVIALDTGPWIYWIEQDRRFLPSLSPVMEEIAQRRVAAVTSVLALLEGQTGALRKGDEVLARRYAEVFANVEGVFLVEVTISIAARAARLRAGHRGIRTPDAIHLATALEAGASAFVTTDRRLARVREMPVHVLRPIATR
jgi:predicted nucleic acid-binding protein